MAKSRAGGPWRKRPATILWMLSIGQLISWGLVYYTFPLFVVPMTQELGWSRSGMVITNSLFILLTGRARVVASDERGREVILATLSPASRTACLTTAKESIKNVTEAETSGPKWILATHVVVSAGLLITEHLVSVGDQLEALVVLIAGSIDIRVEFAR